MVTTLQQNYVDPEIVSQVIRQVSVASHHILSHTLTLHTDVLCDQRYYVEQLAVKKRIVSLVQRCSNEVHPPPPPLSHTVQGIL